MRKILGVVPLLLGLAGPAPAEVGESGDHGFSVSHSIETAAPLMVIHRTMTSHINQWWDGDHSWSGDADNLYMDAEIGGCFCERLPGGGRVEHLRIIYYKPGSEIRFDGALGPLQTMAVQGRMIWEIVALNAEDPDVGSRISFTYKVHGHLEGGFTELAPVVDRVIGAQLDRLGERLKR
jgi:hypothetical protein